MALRGNSQYHPERVNYPRWLSTRSQIGHFRIKRTNQKSCCDYHAEEMYLGIPEVSSVFVIYCHTDPTSMSSVHIYAQITRDIEHIMFQTWSSVTWLQTLVQHSYIIDLTCLMPHVCWYVPTCSILRLLLAVLQNNHEWEYNYIN